MIVVVRSNQHHVVHVMMVSTMYSIMTAVGIWCTNILAGVRRSSFVGVRRSSFVGFILWLRTQMKKRSPLCGCALASTTTKPVVSGGRVGPAGTLTGVVVSSGVR